MGALVGGLYAAGLSGTRADRCSSTAGASAFPPERRAAPASSRSGRGTFEDLLLADYKNRFISKISGDKTTRSRLFLVRRPRPHRGPAGQVRLQRRRSSLRAGGAVHPGPAALRATMSVPLVFEPVRMGGMLLLVAASLDGAPVEAAQAAGSEVAISSTSAR
ncbi:MAG: hypothetical protein MZU95_01350 [Desulfomicrobium escambiense]|nr:hypothetical protein [Desulfomicrobium escambiense]